LIATILALWLGGNAALLLYLVVLDAIRCRIESARTRVVPSLVEKGGEL